MDQCASGHDWNIILRGVTPIKLICGGCGEQYDITRYNTLSHQHQILHVLYWACRCDDEGFIDEDDWPLIQSLAESININPASVVPSFAKEINGADPYADYRFDREWKRQHG